MIYLIWQIYISIYRDYWAALPECERIRKKDEIELRMIQLKRFKERMDLLGVSKVSEHTKVGKELLDEYYCEMKKLEEEEAALEAVLD